jgi:DNA-directed RNA polymerase II subunit RPB2
MDCCGNSVGQAVLQELRDLHYDTVISPLLLRSHMQTRPFGYDHILAYDNLVTTLIPRIIAEKSSHVITSEDTELHITFANPRVTGPLHTESNGKTRIITPHECRLRELCYEGRIVVDMTTQVFTRGVRDGPQRIYKELSICMNWPIMVGSRLCTREPAHECELDDGGYFIIRGYQKICQGQKDRRPNIPIVSMRKGADAKDGSIDCEIRSLHENKLRSTSTLHIYLVGGGSSAIVVLIPFLKVYIPIIGMFTLLGIRTREEIMHYIFSTYTSDSDVRIEHIFECNFHVHGWDFDNIYEEIRTRANNTEIGMDIWRRKIDNQVATEFLPHLGYDDDIDTLHKKAYYLGLSIRRILLTHIDAEHYPCDYKDFEGNKSLYLCNMTVARMFRQLFTKFVRSLRSRIYTLMSKHKYYSVVEEIIQSKLSDWIRRAFTTGEVVVAKRVSSVSSGVIQLRTETNPIAARAHSARVNTPMNREGKYSLLRQYDVSKSGLLCPHATPEGEDIGLLENPTLFAHTRIATPIAELTHILEDQPLFILFDEVVGLDEAVGKTLVLVNGMIVGFTTDALELGRYLRSQRRNGLLPYDCSVSRRYHGLCMDSDEGVMMFPSVVLENIPRIREALHFSHRSGEALWDVAIRMGIIEYISAYEALDNLTIAYRAADILRMCADPSEAALLFAAEHSPLGIPYTHVYPHIHGLQGISTALTPFANYNQGPRVTYQSGMLKQAIGIPYLNFQQRFDGMSYLLWYPQRPICDTDAGIATHMTSVPCGQNFFVAIADIDGMTIEDAVVLNKASLDRGLGRVTMFRTFSETIRSSGSGGMETFEHPWGDRFTADEHRDFDERICRHPRGPCFNLRKRVAYTKIGRDGLPEIGAVICEGDILIGKTYVKTCVDETGREMTKRYDVSRMYKKKNPCVVDNILVTSNQQGNTIVKIRVRIQRPVMHGDKFSSRHGQKGTVGAIIQEEDLPFVASGDMRGLRPDILVSPCGIAKRMTMGK